MRVPGGWIYTFHDCNGWTLSSQFVGEVVEEVDRLAVPEPPPIRFLPDVPVPKRPVGKIIKEGCTNFCSECGSSAVRDRILFGDLVCINPECHSHD